ncbi:MAG: NAD-binding protein [Coriobacteriia bacterium]|nr:NAD-binding protein [Coriobacteriia bacterium]
MKVVIVGGGKVGSNLALMMGREGHDVTLVEIDRDKCTVLGANLSDVRVMCGDGDEPTVLEAADIRAADVVVAATGDDEDNLVVCLLAKAEYEAGLTMARVSNPKNEWLFTPLFGVDVPVSQTSMIANLLREHVPG